MPAIGGATPGKRTLVDGQAASPSPKPPARDEAGPAHALRHVRTAERGLDRLLAMVDRLHDRGRSADPGPAVEVAKGMVRSHDAVIDALEDATRSLRGHDPDEVRAHPHLEEVIERVTWKLAMYISGVDAVGDKHAQVNAVFHRGHLGRIAVVLASVRGDLGLKRHSQFDLKELVDVPVTVDMVRLGNGTPRDKIQESVYLIRDAWNRTVTRFALAVRQFVDIIEQEELKKADSSLLEALWDAAKGVLEKGSSMLAGTTILAKLGIMGLEHLRAHEQDLERARRHSDKRAFIWMLEQRVTEMQIEEGSAKTTDLVDQLDADFSKAAALNAKEYAEDTWKPGHRVVFGAQAEFLQNLRTRAEAYAAATPPHSTFTGRFLVEWVNANHKRRRSDSRRSPFADSMHWDGYIACTIDLRHFGGTWMLLGDGATLHCPKSEAVAEAMMRTIEPFDVSKVECPVHVEVTCSEHADELPPFMRRAVPFTLRLNPYRKVEGAGWMQDAWDWIRTATDQSAHRILARFTKLSGG